LSTPEGDVDGIIFQGGCMKVRPLYLMNCLVAALLLAAAGMALSQNVQAQAPPAGPQPAAKADAPAAIEPSAAAASLPAGIDKALEKALDKKLAPIMRTLAEMQEQKVRLTDVLGGIGYIIGLVGMAAYFKRKPG
jgi:nickel transport protein